MNKKGEGGKANSTVPKYSGDPKGGKQSSGKTKHDRMKMAAKVENLNGMPKSH